MRYNNNNNKAQLLIAEFFWFQEYVIALKNAQAGLLLSDEDTENLFGNIKDIYVFNRYCFLCRHSQSTSFHNSVKNCAIRLVIFFIKYLTYALFYD